MAKGARTGITERGDMLRKRILSLLLCFLLAPVFNIKAADSRILPEKTNLAVTNNPSKGIDWLSSESRVKNLVLAANNRFKSDESIYTIAKKSIIILPDKTFGYINGYRISMSENSSYEAIFDSEGAYVPPKFLELALNCEIQTEKVTQEDEEYFVVTVKASKELEMSTKDNIIYVDGAETEAQSTPIYRKGIIYLPVGQIAELLGKSVVFDKRGVMVVTTAAVAKTIEEKHIVQMTRPYFYLDREKILHPMADNVIGWMIHGSRTFMNYTTAQIDEAVKDYDDISYKELYEKVKAELLTGEDGKQRHIGDRPSFERIAALMAVKYAKTKDEDLALRIMIMCYVSALHFDDLATYEHSSSFYNYSYVTPIYLVYAYDKIYHSPMWGYFDTGFGCDAKAAIRLWLKTIFDYFVANRTGKGAGNYPILLGHMAGVAFVLDEPDYIRNVIEQLDTSISPKYYFADGMWYEGSFSYASSTVGNCYSAARLLRNYRDRRCYKDETYGLVLDGGFDTAVRWTDFFDYVGSLCDSAVYPDGSPIAINDTHWQNVSTNLANRTPKQGNLENIEMNHFGLYGLRYGDTEEAQQLNMQMQAATHVSHQHSNFLGITYFSGGIELLPDAGYAPVGVHRYSKTPVFAHNTAYTSNITEPSADSDGSYYARPNVYAYDDGKTSNKAVQLIEGSNLMPENYNVGVNRRAVFMIATDKNHSYAVDIHRISGGEARECYLAQTEDEDVEFTASITPSEAYSGTLPEWVKEKSAKSGPITTSSYASVIKNPQEVATNQDFSFTWKGKTSGTSLNAFIKGNENSYVAFCTWPTVRRTEQDSSLKNNFPGYYLYRRVDSQKDDITTFGAVYEGVKDGESARVLSVNWLETDGMMTALEVELEDYIDYIYVSADSTERAVLDFVVSGSYIVARRNKESGDIVFSYIYGTGKVECGTHLHTGEEEFISNVTSASGSQFGANKLVLAESARDIESGLWGNVTFSDGSGTAFKVESTSAKTVNVNNNPGFTISNDGAVFTAYPMYEEAETGKIAVFGSAFSSGMEIRKRSGDVVFTMKKPSFKTAE